MERLVSLCSVMLLRFMPLLNILLVLRMRVAWDVFYGHHGNYDGSIKKRAQMSLSAHGAGVVGEVSG